MKTLVLTVCGLLVGMLVVLLFATCKGKAICSIDVCSATVRKNDVEVEVAVVNHSNKDIYVFGLEDCMLPVCFLKDGEHWMYCSSANDVIVPGIEKGVLVKEHQTVRLNGFLPKECWKSYWCINLGVGTRSAGIDSVESIEESPVYSLIEKNERWVLKKVERQRRCQRVNREWGMGNR